MKKSRTLILLGGLCLLLAYILSQLREDARALKEISLAEAQRQESLELFLLRGSELPSDIALAWQERLTQLGSIHNNEKHIYLVRIAFYIVMLLGLVIVAFRRWRGVKYGDKKCRRSINS